VVTLLSVHLALCASAPKTAPASLRVLFLCVLVLLKAPAARQPRFVLVMPKEQALALFLLVDRCGCLPVPARWAGQPLLSVAVV
jgi:hypothetical protein